MFFNLGLQLLDGRHLFFVDLPLHQKLLCIGAAHSIFIELYFVSLLTDLVHDEREIQPGSEDIIIVE